MNSDNNYIFQGILKNIEVSKTNNNLKKILFEKEILIPSNGFTIDKITLEFVSPNRLSYHPLGITKRPYELNPKIRESIYNIAKKDLSGSGYEYEINLLNSELSLLISKKDQVKFLEKENSKLMKKIKKGGFLFHFNNIKYPELKFDYHLQYVIETGCQKVIDEFLSSETLNLPNHFNNSDILYVCKGILYLEKHKFIIKNLNELSENKRSLSKKKLPPLHFVCYIDNLRLCSFTSLEYSEKLTHLNNITGGQNYQIKQQLEVLEKLVELNADDYDFLMQNQTKYSEVLQEISKVNDRNTRGAIKTFLLSQEKINFSEDSQSAKYYKARKEVENANNKIAKYFG